MTQSRAASQEKAGRKGGPENLGSVSASIFVLDTDQKRHTGEGRDPPIRFHETSWFEAVLTVDPGLRRDDDCESARAEYCAQIWTDLLEFGNDYY